MGGRARANLRSEIIDRTWMKWARCSVCRHRMCVNNFPDRQVHYDQYKFLKRWICTRCLYDDGKTWIKLMILVERMAERLDGDDAHPENCKCDVHVALRLIAKHNELRLGP